MVPKTPDALYGVLLRAFWMRVHGDLTAAARRKRLTEHDIAQIEDRALALAGEARQAAGEFKDFDAAAVVERVLAEARENLRVIREARAKQIANEH